MDWTIDTCILHHAADADPEAMHLLLEIMHRSHGVAFDQEGHIEKEYRGCLERKRNRLVAKWFKVAVKKLAVLLSGKLDERHQRALTGLKLDPDDWPFAAVSSKTAGKKLVSEDSDYTVEVRQYLTHQMGVAVLSAADALRLCG
jgi:hypothetical protein